MFSRQKKGLFTRSQKPLEGGRPFKGLVESENKEKKIVVLKLKNEDSLIKDENRVMLRVAFQEKIEGAIIKCSVVTWKIMKMKISVRRMEIWRKEQEE